MIAIHVDFKIFKRVLSNGLTVLVKPSRRLPRVQVDLWYRVGSKHEQTGQKGMAHLIEHMLFKGTSLLSESDMDLVAQKLASYSNAFTSQDATCYVMRLPTSAWPQALTLFAESMKHARFEPQALASELKAVIEELRMYSDDFENVLIETMLASTFSGHPYQTPIIGTKYDLCALQRDDLFAFYQQHYNPTNAVLVVVGDVEPEEVFDRADQAFGVIGRGAISYPSSFPLQQDIVSKSVTLYRPVTNPTICFMYIIPGFGRQISHLFDIASLILSNGKSSRLYQLLVQKEGIAFEVDSFAFNLHEQGLFGISVSPRSVQDIPRIEELVNKQIYALVHGKIADWEFVAAQKRAIVDMGTLFESNEHQAYLIGSTYLATGDVTYAQHYLQYMLQTTAHDLQATLRHYLRPSVQSRGYLLPIPAQEKGALALLATQQNELEREILHKNRRSTPIEEGKYVHSIDYPAPVNFAYPKPESAHLDNGLEILWHHNPAVTGITIIFSAKVSHQYEKTEHAGICGLLFRLLTQRTAKYSVHALHKQLEMHGIVVAHGINSITMRCVATELNKALAFLATMLTEPSFDASTIKKLVQQAVSDIDDFWDTPLDFVDQLAHTLMYQDHPYANNPLGTQQSLQKCTPAVLRRFYETFISPHGATLVLVGNLNNIDVRARVRNAFGAWSGSIVPDVVYPEIKWPTAQKIVRELPRNQVVLGFVGPSISRHDPRFLAAAVLDVILSGGVLGSSSSRLFALRQQSGLFYTISGSLLYDASQQKGIAFIKTIVSSEKVVPACQLILETINRLALEGVSKEEFLMAKHLLTHAPVELFETNTSTAKTFLFIKKHKLPFDLFDKQGQQLSILNIDDVHAIAQVLCDTRSFSVITIGRVEGSSVSQSQFVPNDEESTVVMKKKTVKKAVKKTAKKATAKKVVAKKATAKKAPAKKRTVKKASPAAAKKRVVKKATAKKSTAKKATAKRAPAKKAGAKRAPAKKAGAKRSPAKKAGAKKTTAKRAPARKAAVRKAKPARRKASVAKKAPEAGLGGAQQPA